MAACLYSFGRPSPAQLQVAIRFQVLTLAKLEPRSSPEQLPSVHPWQPCICVARTSETRKEWTWRAHSWPIQPWESSNLKAMCLETKPLECWHLPSRRIKRLDTWTLSQTTWLEWVKRTRALRKWSRLWYTTRPYSVSIWPITASTRQSAPYSATYSIRKFIIRRPSLISNLASINSVLKR